MIEKYFGFIGYEKQAETAYGHFMKGRSVIFMGPAGCGKTSLITACTVMMAERRHQTLPMIIPFCSPLKQFLITLVKKLHRRKLLTQEHNATDWDTLQKRLARQHYRHAHKIALDAIRAYPGLFIGIDNLDDLPPMGRSVVLALIDAGAIVCTAATKRTDTVRRIMYQLQQIPVPPMSDEVTRKITEAFINERGMLVEDRQHFIESMVWKSSGNILQLDTNLRYFENEPVVKTDDVRKITQQAGRVEVSLEWMLYAGFAFMLFLRAVSRTVSNKELLIISAAATSLFVIVRFVIIKGSSGRGE